MTDSNENKARSRRKLLKSLATGGGAAIAGKSLPESWSRPIVDSVMLPAHAQTSPPLLPTNFTGSGTQAAIDPGSRFAQLLGGMVNEAQALALLKYVAEGICIKFISTGIVSVDALITDGYVTVDVSASSVPVGAGPPTPMSDIYCGGVLNKAGAVLDDLGLIPDAQAGIMMVAHEVQVTSINGRAVGQFLLYGGQITIPFDIPPGDCTAPSCPPAPFK